MQNKQKFIIKLFPEIMVKGSSAKRQMIGQLYNNVTTLLKRIDKDIDIKKFLDKIEVTTHTKHTNEVKNTLLNTPGIETLLEVIQFDGMRKLDDIKRKVAEVIAPKLDGKTFVVRAKRSGSHDFKSVDIERVVGGHLKANSNAKGVDLHNPDIKVMLEVVENKLNIITSKHKALGGFPIGTQGDILSLMSGGFDSTIASYLSIKRGIKTHFIFFNLGGAAHEIGVKQVALYLWSKFSSSHRVKFITIPFEDVVTEIFRSIPPSYMGVMLKRIMLQASEKIADEMGIDALLTGESVAQVSSQTLRNLSLIDQATNKLVLRPLAMMNKPEIIDIADKIGTKHFAESMPEYCGVISQNPVTHGSFKRIDKVAKQFNYEVLEKAVKDAKKIYVDEIAEDINKTSTTQIVHTLSDNDVVIDIRGKDEPINLSVKTLNIPFYDLKKEFTKLPKDKTYLLYCDKGIMSQLHAQYLKDQLNVKNIKVYRPT